MGVKAGREPIGREMEMSALARVLDRLHEEGAAVLVRGEAGIGKTTLWWRALARAEASGVRVLAVRCAEAEMPIAMCGLADLFEAVPAAVLDRLPLPQREALERALGLGTEVHAQADRIALPRAVTAALRTLTERQPVLLAVDDAQWLDPASRRLVSFALRRLVDQPVGALVTLRGGTTEPDPLGLDACFGRARCAEIRLGPLSAGALGQLLRSSLDVQVPRPALKRIQQASGGNPLYALELVRSLAERDETRSLAHVPLPASLDELMDGRINRLPEEIRALLEVVAALERPTLAVLRQAVDDAPALLDAAVGVEALVVDDDGLVRFAHPLLAAALYSRVPPSRRRELHACLGALAEDPEEQARHLALAAEGPDEYVAAMLMQAAEHAAARGAPDGAATLVEHARKLTPPGHTIVRAERVLVEAAYLVDAGELGRARALVDDLLATALHGPPRARALQLRYHVAPPPSVRECLLLLEEALDHTDQDEGLHVRLLSWLAWAYGYAGDYRAAEERALAAVELARRLGDEALLGRTLVDLFHLTTVRGTRPAAAEDLLGVPPPGQLCSEFTFDITPAAMLGRERCCAGDLVAARAALEREVTAAADRGAEHPRAAILSELADVELRAGNWALAGSYLDEALGIQSDGDDLFGQAVARSRLALLAVLRGDVAEARGLAGDAVAVGKEWDWQEFVVRNRWILGFLELSLGEPARAWGLLEGLPEALRRMGIGEPGHLPALPDIVETLAALGRLDEAETALAELEWQARALEHRWATPAALRSRALLALACGESEEARELADRAASAFEATGFPFDRGRSLLVAGDALRRLGQRRRAAERIEEAGDVFEDLGARLWHDRAERELHRAAPRRARTDELTEAERRVAALVATGRTNREVAAELFTTVSTVEAHLTRIYRKLGVRSRTELARREIDLL